MLARELLECHAFVGKLLECALRSNRKPAATRAVYQSVGLADQVAALDRLVAANLLFTVGYYVRFCGLLCEAGRRWQRRTVQPVGYEHLRHATAGGRGVILLTAHLGDFDLAAHWVASELGRRLVVTSAPLRPQWRGTLYEQIRSRAGFRVRRQEQTTLHNLADDIAEGNLVLFLADRRAPGRPLPVNFLGRQSMLSAAPSWLSARTGAPVLTAATYTSRQCRKLVFGPPRWAADASDHHWVAPALRELESCIRRAPYQWHVPADLRQLPIAVKPPHTSKDRRIEAILDSGIRPLGATLRRRA